MQALYKNVVKRIELKTWGKVFATGEEGDPDYCRNFGLENAYEHLRMRGYRRIEIVFGRPPVIEIWETTVNVLNDMPSNRVPLCEGSSEFYSVAQKGHPDYWHDYGRTNAYDYLRSRGYRRIKIVKEPGPVIELWEKPT